MCSTMWHWKTNSQQKMLIHFYHWLSHLHYLQSRFVCGYFSAVYSSDGLCKHISRRVICNVFLTATFACKTFNATFNVRQHNAYVPVLTSLNRTESFPLTHLTGVAILIAQDENNTALTVHSVFTLCENYYEILIRRLILSAFAKLWKTTMKLSHICPSVRPSVRMEQLGSHWTNFHEIWYLCFEPLSWKLKFH